MIEMQTKYLLFNGSIVLLVGLLSGVPMGVAIIQKKGESTIHAWRVAHSTLIMDGLMMIILGFVAPDLPLSKFAISIFVWALMISGYGFIFALTMGASIGHRGLTPTPYGINTALYGCHIIGALGSLIGVVIFIFGFCKTL